jgi:WD40 repeat protein
MARTWRTVRVFISSTFRDMHAERDHLVRVVFPELKERCQKRRIQLIDVDLRWGVTEKQAEGGGALDICLDEIDTCRPFFLGLLGQRYGYTPPGQEHSITAQEIYHGVLHNYLPRQVVDLRPIVEGILEGRTLLKEQVNCLVRCYQWDADKGKYLLQEDVIPEDEETLHSIFAGYSIYQRDHSFFFFRSESLTEELRKQSESKLEDYFETDKAARDKLAALKQDIIDAKLAHFGYSDLETFGQMVLDTLWKRIDAEFPEERAPEERDWLEEEAEFHEIFMAERTRRFVGRSDLLADMHAFVEKDSDQSTLVITGEPGCGKSALMARFTEEVSKNHPDWLIIPHFVGASPSSTSMRSTLRRFCTHLNRALGVTEEAPEDYKELAQLFPQLLESVSENRHILLVIDALNQFEKTNDPQSMTWLPQALPEGVKIVVSTLAGEALDSLKTRSIQPRFEKVSGLTEPEIKELVTNYLGEVRKDFPTPKIREDFYEKIKAGHPLYILVALEELRVFPVFEKLGKRIAELPSSVPELFDQVLERVEGDFSQPLVRDFTSFIACGRQGMTGEELQTLLKGHAPVVDPSSPPQKLPDMLLARLRRALSAYLFERSGVMDFFHGQLKEAVGRRYLPEEVNREKTHQVIAEYFEKRWAEPYLRAIDELPHQLTKAKDWEGVERVLCDLHFIEAKCASGMTYDLIDDYNTALNALPEAQEERQKEREHEARVKKYTEDLIAYAKGEIEHLDIIPSVEPWSEEKIKEDTQRIINSPTRLDKVRAFSQFVTSESHVLVKFASHPGFCMQQAYNSARSGPIASAAETIINTGVDDVLLLRPLFQCPSYNQHTALLKTLEGHRDWVNSVAITPNGKRAVSASRDYTLRVWDLESGECLRVLEGHTNMVVSVSITPDGKRAASGSWDETLRVWDLESGECLRVLEGHTYITSVSITPDGKKAVSTSINNTLRVWDLESGECLETFEGHTAPVESVRITPDGKRAVSGSWDNTLRVWDIESGECLGTFEGYASSFETPESTGVVSITPDGKRAVSVSSMDALVRVWDLESSGCIKTLRGSSAGGRSVSITPDGKRAISGSGAHFDKTLLVWNLESGECLGTLEGHTDDVLSVSITPDGKRAVSGGMDNTLKMWNLESGEYLGVLEGHHLDNVKSVSITPNGKRAVSGSVHGTLKVWDLESGECLGTLEGYTSVESVCITPDGKRAVSGSRDKTLRLWDLESGECLRVLEGHTGEVKSVNITPDEKRIVSTSVDKTLKVWDLESGECLGTLEGHASSVESVSITPDGKRAVSRGGSYDESEDNTLRVWDLESGECLKVLAGHTRWVTSVAITPDGKRAVSASVCETLKVWDLESGKCLKVLDGHRDWVNSVVITPDGKRAVSASFDKTLKVWDLESGECLGTLEGHTDDVPSVSVTPDGKRAVSGSVSEDNTLRVWDLESGEDIAVYQTKTSVRSLSDIRANQRFACGTWNEVILIAPHNLAMETLSITPVRIWLYGEGGYKGRWDNNITAVCQWCGRRFPVSDEVLNVITAVTRDANLSHDQSPCLELPVEAWEEPCLLSECPLCHQPLKFNPFIVDNRGRY